MSLNFKLFSLRLIVIFISTLIFGQTAVAQIYFWRNPSQRPGESAWDYGARIAKESQQKVQLERTKYQRSATWPKTLRNYTKKKRLYLEQIIMANKWTMSLSAMPGENEQGLEILFQDNIAIGYVKIDRYGNYISNKYSPIGTIESGKNISKYVAGDDSGDILIIVNSDHNLVVFYSESHGITTKEVYDNTKERANKDYMTTPGIVSDDTSIQIDDGSNSSTNNAGKRKCPSCNGSGKGISSKHYAPDYTGGQSEFYCTECRSWGSRHTHIQSSCKVCGGKGYL